MNDFHQTQNKPFYPEDLNFNAETQKFSQPPPQNQPHQNNPSQNPLFNLLGWQNANISSLFGKNGDLLNMLMGNILSNNSANSNPLLQMFSTMIQKKTQPQSSNPNIEKTLDIDSFEEI